MGLFERARSLARAAPAPRKAGLLHRSRRLLEQILAFPPQGSSTAVDEPPGAEPAPAEGPVFPPQEARLASVEQRTQEILAALSRLRRGFEAPASLFELLEQELGLSKAALLLYDPLRMVFAPWASRGCDATSLRRLRIPPRYSPAVDRLAGGETLYLSEAEDLEELRGFFSFRAFSTMNQDVLLPLVHERRWIALLVITEQKATPVESDPVLLRNVANRSAEFLYEARERHLEALNQDREHLEAQRRELLAPPSALPQLLRRCSEAATANGRTLLVIRLSFHELFARVRRTMPALDAFRLREDVFRLVSALFASLGVTAAGDSEHLLVLAHAIVPPDPQILVRHLESVLGRFFPSAADKQDLELHPEVRTWSGAPEQSGQIMDTFE